MDPKRFARGGPILACFFCCCLGREDPNSTKNGNTIKMWFGWRADDGPTLNAAGLVAL